MLLTTLHPDPTRGPGLHATDVDVDEGLAVPALLTHLVRLTGWAGWPQSPVAVGPATLAPGHPSGQYPLVPGCVLRPGPDPDPTGEVGGRSAAALREQWHVAVTSGPDCGAVVGLPPGPLGVRLAAHGSPDPTPGTTTVQDPTWGGLVVQVRLVRHRAGVRAFVRIAGHAPEGTGPAALVRPAAQRSTSQRRTARRRRVRTAPVLSTRAAFPRTRRGWTRWRPGDALHVGASVLELRRSPQVGLPVPTPGDRPRTGRGLPVRRADLIGLLAPALGSVVLAAALRQPLLLVSCLVGPLALLTSRPTREQDASRATAAGPTDPAALAAATVHALWRTGSVPPSDQGGPGSLANAPAPSPQPAWSGALDGPGATLAVSGSPAHARAAARAVLLGAVGPHGSLPVLVHAGSGQHWSWTRWIASPARTATLPTPQDPESVVVVDLTHSSTGHENPSAAASDTLALLASWRTRVPSTHRLLLVVPAATGRSRSRVPPHEGARAVPAWCRTVMEIDETLARLRTPDGRTSTGPVHGVGHGWAEEQARRVAAVRHARAALPSAPGPSPDGRTTGGGPAVPSTSDLGALAGVPAAEPAAVLAAWDRHARGLQAVLGAGPGGDPVTVDLVRDGPHLLVAGTTGAGKSQLLSALVLTLALAHPPERLTVALIDFKGGTSLGAVADLPHVVGRVSDLDAAHATRALTGLRAELRRRERLVGAAGVRDIAELDPGDPTTPARLLVVVDEFRALADELPDALPALARLAAQGRSLGMHLVLATQRPAGAVTPDLRANIALRMCLRVTDAAESQDVLDAPDAARISVSTPGRAWLRRGSGRLEAVQVARTRTAGAATPVRPAPPWSGEGRPRSAPGAHAEVDADARAWVGAIRRAAAGRAAPAGPWLPELPPFVTVAEALAADGIDARGTAPDLPLTLALADLPDEQRRAAVPWAAADGHLLVLGGPRSGRTTTLVGLGLQAAERGWTVHAVGLPRAAVDSLAPTGALGTVVDPDDPRRLARLVELLTARVAGPLHQLLLLDGVEPALAALATVARGAAADRLTALWAERPQAVAVAASAAVGASTAGLAASFRDRVVLPVTDPALDVVAGVPTHLRGARRHPGRAVHLGPTGARLCQVVLAVPPPTRRDRELDAGAGAVPSFAPARGPRLIALPPSVDLPPSGDLPASGGGPGTLAVAIGVGGDRADALVVDLDRGLLVTGPPGSGRSTALATVAAQLQRAGVEVVRLGAAPDVLARATPRVLTSTELPIHRPTGAADPGGTAGTASTAGTAGTAGLTVVVDDLDDLELLEPQDAERLALAVASGAVRLVASALTDRAASAFRGPMSFAVRSAVLLVLDPATPGSADLLGPRAPWLAEPAAPPGRGALRDGRRVDPVQVYLAP